MISAETPVYGIIGYPVKHSLSPVLHNGMFRELKLDGVYVAFEVRDLKDAIRGLKALDIRGVNITIPHKEEALELVDEIEEEARIIGAINTIKNINGTLKGHNTDYRGFIESFKKHADIKSMENIVVLGAGGAARAIIYALYKMGFEKITLINRTKKRADSVKRQFSRLIDIEILTPTECENALRGADAVINCTSVGLKDSSTPVDVNLIDKAIVIDIIYKDTPLIKIAQKKGLKGVNGMEMFIYQAIYSFEIFTGRRVDVETAKRIIGRAQK